MALKFLNKKGWHTGSLRNIENVWKAEQKHDAEQKKLEELRKQIQEERERNEFRLLQEKAGLVPRQERLEFLYDSGLSVGKSSNSEGFKALEQFSKSDATDPPLSSTSASKEGASVPGALFEDKPQSANDAWRKLHSDPLLMIRQREQEALAKIKNNPVKMAMIKKSIEGTEGKEKTRSKKEKRKKHGSSKSKYKKQSDSEDDLTERRKSKHKKQSDSEDDTTDRRKRKAGNVNSDKKHHNAQSDSEYESSDGEKRRRKNHYEDKRYREKSPSHQRRQRNGKDYKEDAGDRYYNISRSDKYALEGQSKTKDPNSGDRRFSEASSNRYSVSSHERGPQFKHRNVAPKLTDEERAAKLRQMQLAAELHEEQRWKRIKKAEESDAKEAIDNSKAGGKNFLDTAQKSVYGAAEGGSTSIAESVRRRTHYSQGRSGGEGNAFRR
ncbi:hypothetical protein Fmac_009394 [Flemingia macrophylla]|uniref:CBF1-interacting co-repressor CIR N-terminal domain-containing protein n=1 Tax=Flemingia macrophylla TaxID=520843 RepID=A0ABD1N066_9FABA